MLNDELCVYFCFNLCNSIPLAVVYHCMKKPLRPLDASDTNLTKSVFPIEDMIGRILDPQYLPIKGDVGNPPFL